MKPYRLQVHLIEAPFKTGFKHSAHERTSSRNVVCGLVNRDNVWGWGEGLPRDYVTGEDADDVFRAVLAFAKTHEWRKFEDLDSLCDALEHLADTALPDHPSGRCAVEIALLDLAAKALGLSAVEVIQALAKRMGVPLRDATVPVIHSGVIGGGSGLKTLKSALKMRLYGLREIKVKVGSDLAKDVKTLRLVRRVMGADADLRVDANGAWDYADAVATIGALEVFGITSVEQPLAKGDEESLPRLAETMETPIALDESLVTLADVERAVERRECGLVNIRLSKCGGVVNSLRMLAAAQRGGMGAWLGCMVGESPMLSAAGRAFALSVEGLRHLEGAFDEHLFDELLAFPPVRFERGGLGEALEGPGLGVQVNAAVLNLWTVHWDHLNLL